MFTDCHHTGNTAYHYLPNYACRCGDMAFTAVPSYAFLYLPDIYWFDMHSCGCGALLHHVGSLFGWAAGRLYLHR